MAGFTHAALMPHPLVIGRLIQVWAHCLGLIFSRQMRRPSCNCMSEQHAVLVAALTMWTAQRRWESPLHTVALHTLTIAWPLTICLNWYCTEPHALVVTACSCEKPSVGVDMGGITLSHATSTADFSSEVGPIPILITMQS
jgi:hypothetical protein